MEPLRFHLNGRPRVIQDVVPTMTVLEFLREVEGLTGTKEGCAEGDCGACTVVLLDSESRQFRAVNSCLVLLPRLAGCHVWTVEGIGTEEEPHPIQQEVVRELASQCGYCTPGFVMSLFEGCYRRDRPEGEPPWEQISGNLCRCTGYQGLRKVAEHWLGIRPDDTFAELLRNGQSRAESGSFGNEDGRFVAPESFEELFDLLAEDPRAVVLAGGTDLGLEVTKRHARWPLVVSLQALAELREVSKTEEALRIGAALPLTDLEDLARRELPVLARMLRYFGGRQIKQMATLGGNLCTASPIGDLAPVLLALDARLIALSREGERSVEVGRFFTGYRQTALRPGEILGRIEIDLPGADVRLGAYKVSRRRELDIATVSAAFSVRVVEGRVEHARLAYGGMAATPKRAETAERALLGESWDPAVLERAAAGLDLDFQPISDHRGSAWYRQTVAKNLLLGFYDETRESSFRTLPSHPVGTLAGT